MKELSHSQIAEILIENALNEITHYLMEDYHFSLEEALDKLYTSKLIVLLQKEEDELYVQSPAYLYEILQKEDATGRKVE